LCIIVDYGYNPLCELDANNRDWFHGYFTRAMGHSKADKAKTHKRIVAIASKRFCENGLGGVGIAEPIHDARNRDLVPLLF